MKKVKIYTFAFNRPDFIPLQQNSFLKYVKDDFEFIVFNTAITKENGNKIRKICEQLCLKCIDIDSSQGSISRHGFSLNWAFHNFLKFNKNTITLLMDPDMFLVSELSVNNYIKDFDVAAAFNRNENINFLNPNLIFFNIDSLPNKNDINFMGGEIEGKPTDTGGHLYYWLKDNPDVKIYRISPVKAVRLDPVGIVPDDIVEKYQHVNRFLTIGNFVLHYKAASNYRNYPEEFHLWKTTLLNHFLAKESAGFQQ
jgi:hypothetical protein